jgi:glycosyltransferase involved in cell wall biosynthesis
VSPTGWGAPLVAGDGVEVWLRTPLPPRLAIGAGTAIFVHGAVVSPTAIEDLQITAGERQVEPLAAGMPSPGLAAELGPRAQRAIFWGLVPLAAADIQGGAVELGLRVRTAAGETRLRLGAVEAQPPATPAATPAATVAICMATYEPDPELLERQLESLRRQSHGDWICVISDDASEPQRFAELERLVGGDERFVVSAANRRAGAYENFHRALNMVPPGIPYVALCDQDDEWYPHKLERLLASIGDAALAFSDMRVVDRDRRVLAETYWTERSHNHANFGSLLLGNTVTGAASLFRRELLELALPLPPRLGNLYHDHWLALVARALGRIEYVAEPLYDYVQHSRAVVGHAGANRGVVGGSLPRRLAALRGRPRGRLRGEWRRIYFSEYCRLRMVTRVLLDRFGDRVGRSERRVLELIERGEGSPAFLAWLSGRQLRRLRRDDTLGAEAGMLRGLAWSRALRLRRARDPRDDADLPVGIVGIEHAQPESVAATER